MTTHENAIKGQGEVRKHFFTDRIKCIEAYNRACRVDSLLVLSSVKKDKDGYSFYTQELTKQTAHEMKNPTKEQIDFLNNAIK